MWLIAFTNYWRCNQWKYLTCIRSSRVIVLHLRLLIIRKQGFNEHKKSIFIFPFELCQNMFLRTIKVSCVMCPVRAQVMTRRGKFKSFFVLKHPRDIIVIGLFFNFNLFCIQCNKKSTFTVSKLFTIRNITGMNYIWNTNPQLCIYFIL